VHFLGIDSKIDENTLAFAEVNFDDGSTHNSAKNYEAEQNRKPSTILLSFLKLGYQVVNI